MQLFHGAAIMAASAFGQISDVWLTVKNFTLSAGFALKCTGLHIIQIMRLLNG